MNTLPNDVARCTGTAHAACENCLRREFWPRPGDMAVWMATPPIDMLTGYCEKQISPRVTMSNNTTTPNVEVTGRRRQDGLAAPEDLDRDRQHGPACAPDDVYGDRQDGLAELDHPDRDREHGAAGPLDDLDRDRASRLAGYRRRSAISGSAERLGAEGARAKHQKKASRYDISHLASQRIV